MWKGGQKWCITPDTLEKEEDADWKETLLGRQQRLDCLLMDTMFTTCSKGAGLLTLGSFPYYNPFVVQVVTWPSTLPYENWGLGNQHKYVDIVVTNFALSSKDFCLWSRDLTSSVSIHETNLLACKDGTISDPLPDGFDNKEGTLTDT